MLPHFQPAGHSLSAFTVLMGEDGAKRLIRPAAEARRVILGFNRRVQEDPRTENFYLPFSDGVTMIRLRS